MESGNYEDAIQSFGHARAQLRPYPNQSLFVISLASFSTLDLSISLTVTGRYLDGNLMISTSQFDNASVMPYIQRGTETMPVNHFLSW